MVEIYASDTLGAALLAHNNDYGDTIAHPDRYTPTVSIAIPYFEAAATIDRCLRCIADAVTLAEEKNPPQWRAQIIVVDDGSSSAPARSAIPKSLSKRCELVELSANAGRAAARNAGLAASRHDVVLFCDADVFVAPDAIRRHLAIHSHSRAADRTAITAGMMHFANWADPSRPATPDFRLDCIYDQAWIGCKEDLRFVGRRFRTLEETAYWRQWPSNGWLGPWTIANMVLGGFFGVDRASAMAAGGFEAPFRPYGFVETTLIAKLLAHHHAFVIPVDGPSAVHVYVEGVALPTAKRDELFRVAHARFFREFLQRKL